MGSEKSCYLYDYSLVLQISLPHPIPSPKVGRGVPLGGYLTIPSRFSLENLSTFRSESVKGLYLECQCDKRQTLIDLLPLLLTKIFPSLLKAKALTPPCFAERVRNRFPVVTSHKLIS